MSGAMLVYLLTISVLLMLAALSAEWLLIRLRRPARVSWSIALLLCVVIPFLASPPSPVTLPQASEQVIARPSPVEGGAGIGSVPSAWAPAFSLPRTWFYLASLIAAGLLFSGWALLLLRARRWSRATLDGVAVLRAPATGPAVVGFFQPRIVVPDWAFGLPPHQRRMLLAHEQSHIGARDPLLLFLSALAVVAMPWNPLLWVGLHRLRAAIEIDCDRRVLATGERADDYARCLVDLITLAAAGPVPAVGSLSLSASFLERRVDLMLRPARFVKLLSLFAVVATIALVNSAFRATPPARDTVRWQKAVQAMEAQPYRQAERYYDRLLNGRIGNTEMLYGVFYDDWSIRDPKAKGC